jgi:putative inorganic carbon (hco3(-)) transporter
MSPRIEPEHGLSTLPERTSDAPPRGVVLFGAGIVAVSAVAAAVGLAQGSRAAALLPIAAAAGLGMLLLATSRFVLFVALLLIVRASLDAAKLGGGSADATGAASVLFIVVSLAWLYIQRRSGEADTPNPVAPLLPPLIAVFVAGLVSVTASTHPLDSLTEAVRIGTLAVIVAVLGRIATDERNANLMLVAVFASAVIPLAAAAFELADEGLVRSVGEVNRIRSTFSHANPFSAYLFLIITLGVALLPHVRMPAKLPLFLVVAGASGAMLTTQTRGSWIALIVGLTVIGILQDRRILVVMVAGVLAALLLVPSVALRLSDLGTDVAESGATGNSLVWRFEYWEQVLSLQRNPVTGIGLTEIASLQGASQQSHNDLVRVYVEMGLLGLLAYGWLAGTLIVQARNAVRRAPPGMSRGFAIAFAGAVAGILLMSLAANVISQLVILWYFAAIATLAIASTHRAAADARA